MKKFVIAIVTACMAMIGVQSCTAQIKTLKDAAAIDGVTSIYLSKTMLSLAGGISGVDGLDQIKPFIKKLDGIELVVAESDATRKKLEAECAKVVDKLKCELITCIKDDDSDVRIYAYNPVTDRKTGKVIFSGLLMLVNDSDDYVAIYIDGEIDAAGLVESYAKKERKKTE